MRAKVLLGLAVVMFAAAAALWLDARGNRGVETTKTTHVGQVGNKGRKNPATATTNKTTEQPPTAGRSDALIIGAVVAGLVLMLAWAFEDRLVSVKVGSVEIGFSKPVVEAATRAAAEAPQATAEASERAVPEALDRLEEQKRQGRSVGVVDAEEAVADAIRELVPDLTDEIVIEETPAGTRVSISARVPRPPDGLELFVMTEPRLLPLAVFTDEEAVSMILDASAELGRRLHADVKIGEDVIETVAALAYDLPASPARIAIRTIITHEKAPTVARRVASLNLTQYLDVVARKLGRPPGLLIRPDAVAPEELTLLGFEPATDNETQGQPDGTYWIQRTV